MIEEQKTSDLSAVAVKYDADENVAPKVTAKGRGKLAENIISIAQNNAVPVYQNKTLVGMLMAIDVDREIPPALYKAVAEVLAYVYRLDKKNGHIRNNRS